MDLARAQRKLDSMALQVPLESPWTAPKASDWDSQTFWSWMRANLFTKGAWSLVQLVVEAVFAAEPEDLSLLHVLFYIHSAGGFDRLVDTEGGAQQDRFVGGSQLVAQKMAEDLGRLVVLETPVRRIAQSSKATRVTAEGMLVTARRTIVALPPTLCGRLVYDPPMPGFRDQLTQRMPQGSVIKCMAVYDEPFWRAEGLTGQATSDTGPLKLTFDNSPPSGTPGVLLGFLEGRAARLLGREPEAFRREVVLDCLSRYFGPRALEATALHRAQLGRRGVHPRVLRLLHAARRLDRLRAGAARPGRPRALGGRGDGDGLEWLHGRRGAVRRARGPRGHRGRGLGAGGRREGAQRGSPAR